MVIVFIFADAWINETMAIDPRLRLDASIHVELTSNTFLNLSWDVQEMYL